MRLVKKIILTFLIFLVSTVLVFAIAYNLFQGKIMSELEALVNETIEGAVEIDNLDYSFFSSYPKLIIDADTLSLFEKGNSNVVQQKVGELYGLHLQLDIKKAIQGVYIVDNFILSGGEVNLITYADSSLNVLNAVNLINNSSSGEESKNADSVKLQLSELLIRDLEINYFDQISDQQAYSKLEKFSSEIQVYGDSLIASVDFTYLLDSLIIENRRILKNQRLSYTSVLNGDISKLLVKVTNGKVKLNLLEANIDGLYIGEQKGMVDFKVWAKHTDLAELAKMDFLKEENLSEIKHGVFEIDAIIKGFTKGELPLMEGTATLDSLQVYNRFGKMVNNAGFKLSFSSESTSDLMDAHLEIDSFFIDFTSGGFLKAQVESKHFKEPEFKISWEASENLKIINNLIEIPGLKKMSGEINSKGAIQGIYQLRQQKLLDVTGFLDVTFNDAEIVLDNENYTISSINTSVYMANDAIGIANASLIANGNKLSFKGSVNQLVPYLLGKQSQFSTSISIQSDKINTLELLAFSEDFKEIAPYNITKLDVSLTADMSSKSLENFEIIPTANLAIKKITVQVEGYPNITGFKGAIDINPDTISFNNFNGAIGDSHFKFSLGLINYEAYSKNDSIRPMEAALELKSNHIIAKDVFTVGDKFLLPKSYKDETLANIKLKMRLISTNKELQKKELLPELEFQLLNLNFETLHLPVAFKNISIFGLIKDNNVYVNSFFGQLGKTDIFMNAEFDNVVATKDTVSRPVVSKMTFNSGVFDYNELIKLAESDVHEDMETDTTLANRNPFAADFPVIELSVNIGKLMFNNAVIKNLSGELDILENNYLNMRHLTFDSGEYGSFELDGTLDASDHTVGILSSNIKVSNVDLSKLKVKYIQNDKEVMIRDHFAGIINAKIVATVPILSDFNVDIASLTGGINAKITDGALIDYLPLKEMGKYFKKRDLDNVRFDDLENNIIFDNGKMFLPYMTINTTLGSINLMGFQTMDDYMEYDVQVPISLVAGATFSKLFILKKGDDKKVDKIKKGGKGKYVTLHITGHDNHYDFKIGKNHDHSDPHGLESE
ncbi:MAG: AsmA-like C-terminal region-containing protein [Cyclobacteriaceae bacterium]|nr:AsmA-like C-terminal region-containing protein [Cyclobacteriaceae bacterium]